MTANVVVRHKVESPLKGWSADLFDCCQDMNFCCYGFWCCPCFACTTTKNFGECTCLPLLDLLGPACLLAFAVPLCAPPASLALRVAIRHKYGIQGSICGDLMVSCFCNPCSWCQMAREIQEQNKSYTVVNVQPVAINSQPQVMAPQVYMTNQQNFVMTSPTNPPGMTSPQYPTMTTNPPGMSSQFPTNFPGMTSPQYPTMTTNPPGMSSEFPTNFPGMTSPQSPTMATSPPVMTASPLHTTNMHPPPYNPHVGYGASAPVFPDTSQQIMKY